MLLSRQSLANRAAEMWRLQYPTSKLDMVWEGLKNLGPSPNPDMVDRVIGHSGWTDVWCEYCNSNVEAAVVLGPEHSGDSVLVCEACLRKELEKFDALH